MLLAVGKEGEKMSQDDSDRLDEIEDRLRSLEDNFLTLTTQLDTIIIIAKTCVALLLAGRGVDAGIMEGV